MRFARLHFSLFFRVALAIGLGSTFVDAQDYSLQTGSPTFSTAHPVPLGFLNLANGNLHQQITFGSFLQRGGRPFVFGMVYDSRIWTSASGSWLPNNGASGWRFSTSVDPGSAGPTSFSNLGCWQGGIIGGHWYNSATIRSNFTWTAPDGTTHFFGIVTTQPISGTPCSPPPDIPNGSAHATDSSGFRMVVTNYSSISVFAPDGSQVIPNFEDSNGNFFTPGSWPSETDTLGRTPVTVTTNCNGSSHQTCYNVLNPQGGRSIYTVTTTSITVSTAFGSGANEYSGSMTVVQSIALPDTTSYQFGYDTYGELSSITLPTGGSVSYGYTNYQDSIGNKNRWVTSRTSGGGTWSYTPQVISSCSVGCQQQLTLTKPSGDNTVYTFTLNNGAWSSQVQTYTGAVSSSNLLATRSTTWNFSNPCQTQNCTGNQYIQMSQDTVTWAGGANPSQTKQYTYDSTNDNNVTSFKEWKFYTGSLPSTPDRETDYVYLNTSPYTSSNILNRVATTTVKDSTGTIKFRKDISYDQSSFTGANCITGASQHDDNHYGCSVTTRGNPTSITVYTDPVTPSGGITTTLAYDSLGNLRSSTDPLNHATSFAYTDSWSTSSCGPPSNTYAYATTATNALSQSVSATYDPCTGLLASLKDLNNQPTSFGYDSMLRMTQEAFPDGGQTGWTYNDTANPPTILTTQKLNSTQNLTSTTVLDGLGRVSQTQLTSDPDGTDYVDTTYDTNGRVYKSSNPHRSGSSPTDGTTIYTFDGLDRITLITRPDNSTVQAAFSGNTETVTDEVGNKRQYQSDGLGDLTQVLEDPGLSPHLNYETDYVYDIMGNLLCVGQKGTNTGTFSGCGSIPASWRARNYAYDALSRLTSETNPESGTTTYKYDSDSNCSSPNSFTGDLVSRTDARNIRSCYQYDALNRLTQKSYSDGRTPTVSFIYDVSSIDGDSAFTNTVGRLVRASTAGTYPTRTYFTYDAMGRVTYEAECVVSNCVNYGAWIGNPNIPAWWIVGSTYDLMGNQIAYTDGTGNYSFGQSFNTAGRPTQLTSTDPNHFETLVSSATYFPHGAQKTVNLGNRLVSTNVLNSRLQPCRIATNSTGTPPASCTDGNTGNILDFAYGYNLGASDNGNIASWSASGQQTFNRSFGYDTLNRIYTMSQSSGTTCGSNGSSVFALSWNIDPWGNRTDQNVTSGTCNAFHQSVNPQNQLTGYQYDSAGNLLSDGAHTYQYDGESHLINVDNTNTAFYVYDALGRRVGKDAAGTVTYYVYGADSQLVSEFNTSYNWYQTFIHFGGKLAASYFGSGTYFYHTDHLGSTRLISDSSAHIITSDNMDYLPFGEQISGGSLAGNTIKFTSLERDAETGLDHTDFRQYSSNLGRWMRPDPAGLAAADPTNPQSWNRYSYVINNPLVWTDPSGLDFCNGGNSPYTSGGGGTTNLNPCVPDEMDAAEAAYVASLPWYTTDANGDLWLVGSITSNGWAFEVGDLSSGAYGYGFNVIVSQEVYAFDLGSLSTDVPSNNPIGLGPSWAFAGPPGWMFPKGGPPASGPYYMPKPTPPSASPWPKGGGGVDWEPTPGTDWIQKAVYILGRIASGLGKSPDFIIMVTPNGCIDGKNMQGYDCPGTI